MTPLPESARYFVALSSHAHKACTESELRRLYKKRVIESDTMIALVNTTDWKPVGKVIPDLPALRPLPNPAARPPFGPPFQPSRYHRKSAAGLFGILASVLLLVGLVFWVAAAQSNGPHYISVMTSGSAALVAAAVFCILIAVVLSLAEAAAARQDAILSALNWMIAQRDADAARVPTIAPPDSP